MDSLQLAQLIADNPAIAALGQQYPPMADALNAPTEVNNPDAGKTVTVTTAAPITREGVIALVPDDEAWAIYSAGSKLIDDLFAAIDSNNRIWMGKLLGIAVASGKLSETTVGKLQAELAKTITTTTTQPAKIPGPSIASAAGLGVVTAADVQGADIASNGLWYRGAA